MGNIVLNASRVRQRVLPNIGDASLSANQAYSTSSSLSSSLPSSFEYRNTVTNMKDSLSNIKRSIDKLNTRIEEKITRASLIEQNYGQAFSEISISRTNTGNGGKVVIDEMTKTPLDADVNVSAADELWTIDASILVNLTYGLDECGAMISEEMAIDDEIASFWDEITDFDTWKEWAGEVVDSVTSFGEWLGGLFDTVVKWTKEKLAQLEAILANIMEKTGAVIANIAEAAWTALTDVFEAYINGLVWVWDQFISLASSAINIVVAFAEGVFNFLEDLVDGACILVTVAASIMSVGVDALNGVLYGDWDFSETAELWETTRAFVETEWVSAAVDVFYESDLGHSIDDSAYEWFKKDGTACEFAEKVGYTTASLVLVSTTGVPTPLISSVSGLGRTTESAWNKGATTAGGLAKGFVTAAVDYSLGKAKDAYGAAGKGINWSNPRMDGTKLGVAATVAVHAGTNALAGAASEMTGVATDALYVRPNAEKEQEFLQSLNYDENGNQINNYTSWDELSIDQRFEAYWEDNGAWEEVGHTAAAASLTSLMNEAVKVAKPKVTGKVNSWRQNKTDSIIEDAADGELSSATETALDSMSDAEKADLVQEVQHTRYWETLKPYLNKAGQTVTSNAKTAFSSEATSKAESLAADEIVDAIFEDETQEEKLQTTAAYVVEKTFNFSALERIIPKRGLNMIKDSWT